VNPLIEKIGHNRIEEFIKTRILIEVLGGFFFLFFTYNQSVSQSFITALALLSEEYAILARLTFNYTLMLLIGIVLLGLANYESRGLESKYLIVTGIILLAGVLLAVYMFLTFF
jgi:hypothetical protein